MPIAHDFSNLGGKEGPSDPEDYKLNLGTAVSVPLVYMSDAFFNRKVFYQQQIPDCGANAGAFMAEYLDEVNGQTYSPDFQWIDIKTVDGLPLSDGTDMRSIFKSLTRGSLPYDLLPEQTSLPLSEFSSPKRVSASMKQEAVKHVISTYGFHTEPLTMADLKAIIYQNKAVCLLIRLGNEFWTDKNGKVSWAEKDIMPLRTPKQIVSGHFIIAGAYDENYIYFANWWSKDWARSGYGYFAENYLPQVVQVGTIVDSPDKVIAPTFTRDMYLGVNGEDVRMWQMYLNNHGFLVSKSGQGSPGQETTYFGQLTQQATIAFQKAHNIKPPAGYMGKLTREWVANNP